MLTLPNTYSPYRRGNKLEEAQVYCCRLIWLQSPPQKKSTAPLPYLNLSFSFLSVAGYSLTLQAEGRWGSEAK
jgi:hypothetical protein